MASEPAIKHCALPNWSTSWWRIKLSAPLLRARLPSCNIRGNRSLCRRNEPVHFVVTCKYQVSKGNAGHQAVFALSVFLALCDCHDKVSIPCIKLQPQHSRREEDISAYLYPLSILSSPRVEYHRELRISPVFIMNGFRTRTTGLGHFNANLPFGNNPFVNVPSDVNRNPFRLLLLDFGFVIHLRRLLVKIILPIGPLISGPLDELYPSRSNLMDLALHFILLTTQIMLVLLLPVVAVLFWLVPGVVPIVFLVTFWIATWIVMRLLNGAPTTECLVGLPEGLEPANDEHELWFFINGVATGYAEHSLDLRSQSDFWRHANGRQEKLATIEPRPACSYFPVSIPEVC